MRYRNGKSARILPYGVSAGQALITMCPRGDLNPEGRAFSPIPRLSTQMGEKSPSWGFHAARIAGVPRPASSGLGRPGTEPGMRYLPAGDDACRASQRLRHATAVSYLLIALWLGNEYFSCAESGLKS
jgi:hypothetical protein